MDGIHSWNSLNMCAFHFLFFHLPNALEFIPLFSIMFTFLKFNSRSRLAPQNRIHSDRFGLMKSTAHFISFSFQSKLMAYFMCEQRTNKKNPITRRTHCNRMLNAIHLLHGFVFYSKRSFRLFGKMGASEFFFCAKTQKSQIEIAKTQKTQIEVDIVRTVQVIISDYACAIFHCTADCCISVCVCV